MSFESLPDSRRVSIGPMLARYTAVDIMSSRRNKSDEGRDGRLLVVGGHRIELSHPDKVFVPGCSIMKGDVVDFYRGVANPDAQSSRLENIVRALTGEPAD